MPSAEALTFRDGVLTEPVVAVSAPPEKGLANGLSLNRRTSELHAPDSPAITTAPSSLKKRTEPGCMSRSRILELSSTCADESKTMLGLRNG